MADIMHLLKINVPPERVYAALTTTEGIRNWSMRDADLSETALRRRMIAMPCARQVGVTTW